jgi:hypothetical protein
MIPPADADLAPSALTRSGSAEAELTLVPAVRDTAVMLNTVRFFARIAVRRRRA